MSRTNKEIREFIEHLKMKMMVFESCGLTESDGYKDMKTTIDILEEVIENRNDPNWLMKSGRQ